MSATKDQAIVLRRLDYSETSQVLVFLTREHGPQRLIAKGIKRGTKKHFATGIDLLEQGQIVFLSRSQADQGLGTLTEWRQTNAHLALRRNLANWYAGQYAAEVTAAMTAESDPHVELYEALTELLDSLAGQDDPLSLLVNYQRVLLRLVGLWPDLDRCVICDRPAPPGRSAYFSAHQGGLVCRRCQPSIAETQIVPEIVLSVLREGKITAQAAPAAFNLLDYTITQVVGKPSAVAKFLKAL